MTNEEAIDILMNSNEYHHTKGDLPHSALTVEAFNMAIEALKRPKVTYICKDKGNDYCHHTSYVSMARNFEKVGDNAYEEMER